MKMKLLVFLMAILLTSLFFGCTNSNIKDVEKLISNIDDEITIQSEEAIIEAETAFEQLTSDEKAKVRNYYILVNAREELDNCYLLDETYQEEILYNDAVLAHNNADYATAISSFTDLGEYKDSQEKLDAVKLECYDAANTLFENKEYAKAEELYLCLGDYKDVADQLNYIKMLTDFEMFLTERIAVIGKPYEDYRGLDIDATIFGIKGQYTYDYAAEVHTFVKGFKWTYRSPKNGDKDRDTYLTLVYNLTDFFGTMPREDEHSYIDVGTPAAISSWKYKNCYIACYCYDLLDGGTATKIIMKKI